MAVLPFETVGAPDGALLRGELLDAFGRQLPGVAVEGAAAAPASQPSCAGDAACARRVGQLLGAPHVLGVTVASLARTHVLRARLWRTDDALAEREINETVVGERAALVEVVRGLPLRLLPPRAPRWWGRTWVWAGAAAIAVAAVTSAVLLTRGSASGDLHAPLP